MSESIGVVLTHDPDCSCAPCNFWKQLRPSGMSPEDWLDHLKQCAWQYVDSRQLKLFEDHVGKRPPPHIEILDF